MRGFLLRKIAYTYFIDYRRLIMRVLLALTILLFALPATDSLAQQQQNAEQQPRGPFGIASGSQNTVWRIDQATGMVSYCMRDTISNDPGLVRSRAPICSAWSR
jgi:hypothetical protein